MGNPTCQYIKRDDSGYCQNVKRDASGRLTCPYIKRDGSICGKGCWQITGCSLHWKLYDRNVAKIPCGVCGERTSAVIGYCPKHAKKIYFQNWYERQKAQRIEADADE